MSYWDQLERHADVEMWMAHPAARARINRRVTGEEGTWPTTWLARRLAPQLPLPRVASVGCGLGALERDLVRQRIAAHVTGVDVSPSCIAEARRLAAEAEFDDRIDYQLADAREWLGGQRDLDAVFFHGSLHHFDRLDDLLVRARKALVPGGLLYLDEYVGPARGEWRLGHFLRWNLLYYRLPGALRRTWLVRAPRNDNDPTESIASSSILAEIERTFEIVERRDYGGQLVACLFPYLSRADRDAHTRALAWLLDLEDAELAPGDARAAASSHHAVVLARAPAGLW